MQQCVGAPEQFTSFCFGPHHHHHLIIQQFVSVTSTTLLFNHLKASVNRPPTPDVVENAPEREPTLQELINIKLIETGEKERLMELLRERLVDCGWKDEMKALCRAVVKKKGRNNVTVDELVHVITPKGRASVPDTIKAELLQRIRSFLVSAAL
ncbi:hypothetical protein ACSQ67_025805 [Phaseolus vulgaris]